MSMHTLHPSFADGGPVLTDSCPRCAEHAEHPEATLDPEHQTALRERGRADDLRTALDRRAWANLRLFDIRRGAA